MTSEPTYSALRAHDARVQRMLADPECVGELLLVGIGMARCLDLRDPPFADDGSVNMRLVTERAYGNIWLPAFLVGVNRDLGDRGDPNPRHRIRSLFYADRRRYCPTADGGRRWDMVVCGRPMIPGDGLCDRTATDKRRLTDPLTGRRDWVGSCAQTKCRAWLSDLMARNAADLTASPAPEPPANTGGVLERHLPEIDWWKVWSHVDPGWEPPPEGRAFERPRFTVLVNDDAEPVVARTVRPALVALDGGWR